MIASSAADLRRYPASAAAYLQDGLPPNAQWGIKSDVRLPQDRLKATLSHLAAARPARFLRGRSGAQHRGRCAGRRRRAVGRGPRLLPRSWARAADDSLSRRQRLRDAGTDLRPDAGAYVAPAAAEICSPRAAGPMHRPTRPMRWRCNRPIANACRTWAMPTAAARSAPSIWRRPAPRIFRWSTATATWRR